MAVRLDDAVEYPVMSDYEEPCRRAVRKTLREFGKVGFLIDDKSEVALRRTARELYGPDSLPEWWLVCRSAQCASVALREYERAPVEGKAGVVLVDRRVLRACGSEKIAILSERADDELVTDVLQALTRIQESGAVVEYHTSYAGAADEHVPWRPRATDVISDLRRTLFERNGDLLKFGPCAGSPAFDDDAQFRRARWHRVVNELARKLARRAGERKPVVLFTGAGVSLAARPTTVGMPPTPSLLDAAYALSVQNALPQVNEAPAAACICEIARELHGNGTPKQKTATFDQFCDRKREGFNAADLSWTLLSLFDQRDPTATSLTAIKEFASAFRCVMMRYDEGVTYQHWLLSKLPWHAIVTTNFDGFHERAAAYALRQAEQFDDDTKRYMELALPGFERKRKYVKAYGSLSDPSVLALGPGDIDKRWGPFKRWWRELLSDEEGTIVVLGHSMEDPFLCDFLVEKRSAIRKWEFVWVIPQALSAALNPDRTVATSWVRQMSDASRSASNTSAIAGPLPGRALDFAVDLYAAFKVWRPQQSSV